MRTCQTSRTGWATVLLASVVLSGCGGGNGGGSAGGADAGIDAGADAGTGTDAGVDAGTDAGSVLDGGADAGTGTDAGVDAGTDAGTDAGRVAFSYPPDPSGVLIQSSWLPPDGSDADFYAYDDFTLGSSQTITEVTWRGGYFHGGRATNPVSDLVIEKAICSVCGVISRA